MEKTESCKILYRGGVGELVEKKSRFIATTFPVRSEEEAAAFIEQTRKKYWDARHNCTAWVIGGSPLLSRCSDDGEPAQTAGRPMLDVLLGAQLRDVCVVVTRYFGGTLLGTGGLVRAYSGAATEGLKNSVILEKCRGRNVLVRTDYNGVGKLQYVAGQMGLTIMDTEYTEQVTAKLLVPPALLGSFRAQMEERTAGQAQMELQDEVWYGMLDGKVILL